MLLEIMLRDEYRKGKAEGEAQGRTQERVACILDALEEVGIVSEELKQAIARQEDSERLKRMFQTAVRANSIEEFVKDCSFFF